MSKHHFSSGLEKSLQVALEEHKKSGYPIYIVSYPEVYPKVLFWNRVNPQEFRKTAQWYDQQAAFLHAKSFSFYHITPDLDRTNIVYDAIYIVPQDRKNELIDIFNITDTGDYVVATPLLIPRKRIKVNHPVWEEELMFLSDDRILHPSYHNIAEVIRFNENELWVRWGGGNEEYFIKDEETGVYQFQR